MSRLPTWIRTRVPDSGESDAVRSILEASGLHTVCTSAHCPNIYECFNRGTATFMILGETCTRDCAFCAVETGKPLPPDPDEPARVAQAAAKMKLKHVVITSVTRDDLDDGGAASFAGTISAVRLALPEATIEVLIPDFKGAQAALETVLGARPDVFNHNLETVRRLQAAIRPQADYERSLRVLRVAAGWRPKVIVKSGLMVGLGERDEELEEAMRDLLAAGCQVLTIGQYLAPSDAHAPVVRFVEPAGFDGYGRRALELGFKAVASGPMVRSSYKAGEVLSRAAG